MAKNRRNTNIPTDDVYEIWRDSFSNRENQQVYERTKAWIDNLRQSTIDYSLSNASTRSDLTVEKTGLEYEKDMHTLVGFLSVVDKLLEEIKDTKKWISKRWLSKAWKKGMNNAKFKLNQYEKQLKNKKKTLLKQSKAEIYNNDIDHLRNLRQQLEYVREEIGMAQRWEYTNIASYLYNSPETARKSNKRQADNLEFNQNLNQIIKDGAVLNIFNRNEEEAKKFLTRIAQWEYTATDYQLYVTNSAILNPCCQRYGIAIPTNPRWTIWWIERTSRTVRRSVDYRNMDWWDTFKQWWVSWVLDKLLSNCNNLTPWQRETWKNLWVLAWVWIWIYWLYKFFTNDKMSFWKKAWITVASIFGTEVLLWETPLSLFNKLMTWWLSLDEMKDKFGNAISGFWFSSSESSEAIWGNIWTYGESASETIVPAAYSMMIFNSSTKKSDIDKMTQAFMNDKDNKNWKDFYNKSCNKLKKEYNLQTAEYFQATFSDKFDKDKWENRLASFWVTETTAQNESIYWLANNATMNEVILKKFKTENGLIVTNEEALKAYMESKKVSNRAIDIDDLNEHKNDRFKVDWKATHTERPQDIQNKKSLENLADQLPLNDQKKSELKEGLNIFYDERSIESKPNLTDFSLKMDGGFIILTSHSWNKTKIDINRNIIVWFWSGISFTNLSDLLNTADLANKILESQKWKTPKDLPAFQYKWVTSVLDNWVGKGGRWIYFNDAERWRNFDFDTRVLSGGWWWTIGNIDTLCEHPEEYANYLSERRKEINKLNLTNYPLVKQLWIDFYSNEEEVKKLETYLKRVKEKLSVYRACSEWNPFSKEMITHKLTFERENWIGSSKTEKFFPEDLDEEFPTLTRKWNYEQFINSMNNPDNKMWWSAL